MIKKCQEEEAKAMRRHEKGLQDLKNQIDLFGDPLKKIEDRILVGTTVTDLKRVVEKLEIKGKELIAKYLKIL